MNAPSSPSEPGRSDLSPDQPKLLSEGTPSRGSAPDPTWSSPESWHALGDESAASESAVQASDSRKFAAGDSAGKRSADTSDIPKPPALSSGSRKQASIAAAIAALLIGACVGGFALAQSLAGPKQIATQPFSPAPPASLSSADSGTPSQSKATPAPSHASTSNPIPNTSTTSGATVSIAATVAANMAAPVVRALLNRYFTAINDHDYSAYRSVLDQQMRKDNPSSSFFAGYATTQDSAETITGISDIGSGELAVEVTFASHQDPADSATDSPCTRWAINLYLLPRAGNYLIGLPPSSYSPSFQAC